MEKKKGNEPLTYTGNIKIRAAERSTAAEIVELLVREGAWHFLSRFRQ